MGRAVRQHAHAQVAQSYMFRVHARDEPEQSRTYVDTPNHLLRSTLVNNPCDIESATLARRHPAVLFTQKLPFAVVLGVLSPCRFGIVLLLCGFWRGGGFLVRGAHCMERAFLT